MTKPIFYINSSALSVKSTCSLRLRYTICDGFNQDIGRFNDIHFGTCFHLYMQTLAQTKGDHTAALTKAIECWNKKLPELIVKATKKHIDLVFLANTIQQFKSTYSRSGKADWWDNIENFHYYRSQDDVPFVEQKLVLPYFTSDAFDLVIVGTIDALGWIGDSLCLLDFKTTSSWDVDEFFGKYEVSNQMLLYTWMLNYFAKTEPNKLIGSIFNKHPAFGCSIFGIFHKKGEVNFRRSPIIYFPEHRIQKFEEALAVKLGSIVQLCSLYVKNPSRKQYDGLVNGTCKMYGAAECPYTVACTSTRDEDEEAVLEAKYGRTPYNPLATHEDI